MLDLETLSVRSDAAIIVIGAIKFNRNNYLKPLEEMETFYRLVDIESCTKAGLRIDEETKNWWHNQDYAVRYEALENPNRVSLKKALLDFSAWVRPNTKIWGNGDDFDCSILAEAYHKCEIPVPWKFWLTRDCRTLFDIASIKNADLPKNSKHHALHDCYRQIVGVKKAFNKL